jgi:hypothetical protein
MFASPAAPAKWAGCRSPAVERSLKVVHCVGRKQQRAATLNSLFDE